jgi:hypothetical protein
LAGYRRWLLPVKLTGVRRYASRFCDAVTAAILSPFWKTQELQARGNGEEAGSTARGEPFVHRHLEQAATREIPDGIRLLRVWKRLLTYADVKPKKPPRSPAGYSQDCCYVGSPHSG